jgi:hypothetical protein
LRRCVGLVVELHDIEAGVGPSDAVMTSRGRAGGPVPADVEAERALLASVLIAPSAIGAALDLGLTPEMFVVPLHQHVFDAARQLHSEGAPANDVALVAGRLDRLGLLDEVGGSAALVDLTAATVAISNASRYATVVLDRWHRREVMRLAARASDAAQRGDGAELARSIERLAHHSSPDDDLPGPADGRRRVALTPASSIKPRPTRWLWTDRIPLGALSLLGGREGVGKSTLAYTLTADITRGHLPGAYEGEPRSVLVCATEDSWEHTIVPRLLAAGADLDRVYRVDVTTSHGLPGTLTLPDDLRAVEQHVAEGATALVLLDPLMSRLDAKLDTHKDAEVRLALEPLTALADRCKVAVVGLIHVNKSASTDPLSLLMASRAFPAVARAVLFVLADPDDETIRLLGLAKSNLGRTDLATLMFQIDGAHVADTEEGPIYSSRLRWAGETDRSLTEALEAVSGGSEPRTASGEAAAWLGDYLTLHGSSADHADIKKDGTEAGHSHDALKRARTRIGATSESYGFPRRTIWRLPSGQSGQPAGETAPTALTALTAPNGASPDASRSSGSSECSPHGRGAPTGGRPSLQFCQAPGCWLTVADAAGLKCWRHQGEHAGLSPTEGPSQDHERHR